MIHKKRIPDPFEIRTVDIGRAGGRRETDRPVEVIVKKPCPLVLAGAVAAVILWVASLLLLLKFLGATDVIWAIPR
jgi:hypothetical protein